MQAWLWEAWRNGKKCGKSGWGKKRFKWRRDWPAWRRSVRSTTPRSVGGHLNRGRAFGSTLSTVLHSALMLRYGLFEPWLAYIRGLIHKDKISSWESAWVQSKTQTIFLESLRVLFLSLWIGNGIQEVKRSPFHSMPKRILMWILKWILIGNFILVN